MKPAIVALAHKLALNDSVWREKYLTNLVETAFFYKPDHIFQNISELQTFLKKEDLLSVDILESELNSGIQLLLKRRDLSSLPIGGWKITETRFKKLEETTYEWLALEEAVKNEWLNSLTIKYKGLQLNDADRKALWNCLKDKYVLRILSRHGAEAVRIIQNISLSQEDDFYTSVDKILKDSASNLQPFLKDIAHSEFNSFFAPENNNRRRYLMGLLDEALSQYAVTLPTEIHKKIRDTSGELVLFLDTNFIISALNLREQHTNESVKDIFTLLDKISIQTGGNRKISLRYVSETLDEFRQSLKIALSKLQDIRVTKNLAKTALLSEMFDDITLAYFRRIVEKGEISPQNYFDRYITGAHHILLKEKNIDVYNDPVFGKLKGSQEVIDDSNDFNDYLNKKNRPRKWEQVQHDMRLWHYINGLRKTVSSSSFIGNKYFILTLDGLLCGFERHKYKNQDIICILPLRFLHILSFFVSRTEDFEKALIHSWNIPMARSVDDETEKASLKIVKAMSGYEDFSEEVGIEILKDKALRGQVANIEENEKIRERIDAKWSKELDRERKNRKSLESKISELKKEINELKKQPIPTTIIESSSDIQGNTKLDMMKQIEELTKFKEQFIRNEEIQKAQAENEKERKEKRRLGYILRRFIQGIISWFRKIRHSKEYPWVYFTEYSLPKKEDIYKTHLDDTYCAKMVHMDLKEPKVIKIFDWPLIGTESEAIKECKVAEKLEEINHPHLVRVLDVDCKKECGMYYVMEACDGGNLRRDISQRQDTSGFYSTKDAVNVVNQVLKGLGYFHNLGYNFVHRDIKPENIYSKDGLWKLGDYGTVHSQYYLGALSSRGTHYYRAPEVRHDAKGYLKVDRDYRLCDLYSVGLILKELLTLMSYDKLISSETNTKPSHIDSNTWTVVLKSIEKEPKDRYQSAEGFLEALENISPQ